MIECTAVLGRMVIDRSFHRALFALADDTKEYKDLGDLDAFLNETHQLRLCRWEVMRVNILASQEILYIVDANNVVIEKRLQQFKEAKDDGIVNKMQDAWEALNSSMVIDFKNREHVEFCAALGLACIDRVFSLNLVAASDPDPSKTDNLQTFLTTKNPRFGPPADLKPMNQFLQVAAVVSDMEAFHAERWVQPDNPCDLGYTHDIVRRYHFLSQTEIELLLEQSAPVRNAIDGFREANKDKFAPSL